MIYVLLCFKIMRYINNIHRKMTCVVRCLSCLFCDLLCCECNCIIFPAPNSEYELDQKVDVGGDILWEILSFNSVPHPLK
jgi:hypothetical protein